METLRFCTETPVTFLPLNQISPLLGLSSPAISCISVVLPASVVPSSTLKPPSSSLRLVSWICTTPSTLLVTLRSSRVISGLADVLGLSGDPRGGRSPGDAVVRLAQTWACYLAQRLTSSS